MLTFINASRLLSIFASTWSRFAVPSSALVWPCSAATLTRLLVLVHHRSPATHLELLASLATTGLLAVSASYLTKTLKRHHLFSYHITLTSSVHHHDMGHFIPLWNTLSSATCSGTEHRLFGLCLWLSNILSHKLTRSFARIVHHDTLTDMYLITDFLFSRIKSQATANGEAMLGLRFGDSEVTLSVWLHCTRNEEVFERKKSRLLCSMSV